MNTEQELRAKIEQLEKENAALEAERDEALEKWCAVIDFPGPKEMLRIVREIQSRPMVGIDDIIESLKDDCRNVEADSPIIVTKYAM